MQTASHLQERIVLLEEKIHEKDIKIFGNIYITTSEYGIHTDAFTEHVIKNKKEVAPDAPGMLERHYAPKTKTVLTAQLLETINKYNGKRVGVITFQSQINDSAIDAQIALSKTGDLVEAASNLYQILHQFYLAQRPIQCKLQQQ